MAAEEAGARVGSAVQAVQAVRRVPVGSGERAVTQAQAAVQARAAVQAEAAVPAEAAATGVAAEWPVRARV